MSVRPSPRAPNKTLREDVLTLNVLHDWDILKLSGHWAMKRGISLLSYFLTIKLPFLYKTKYFKENAKRSEFEKLAYMETLIKLNLLCGVNPIFGVRDIIRARYGKEINSLAIKYNVDIRSHTHIGEPPDPDRKRIWDLPLTQSEATWHFDLNYANGMKYILKDGELPIWHVDRPHYLPVYIDYLYKVKVEADGH